MTVRINETVWQSGQIRIAGRSSLFAHRNRFKFYERVQPCEDECILKQIQGAVLLLIGTVFTFLFVLGVVKFCLQEQSFFSKSYVAEFFPHTIFGERTYRSGTHREYYEHIYTTIRRINPRVEAAPLAEAIVRQSALNGFDPLLATSIIVSESTFRQSVISHKGAIGLMQLLPATAQYIAKKEKVRWLGKSKLSSVDYNVKLGVLYFQYLQKKFQGDTHAALMAYNWGPGNVQKAYKGQQRVLPAARRYAQKILGRYAQLRRGLTVKSSVT